MIVIGTRLNYKKNDYKFTRISTKCHIVDIPYILYNYSEIFEYQIAKVPKIKKDDSKFIFEF